MLYWRLAGEPRLAQSHPPVDLIWVVYRARKLDADAPLRGLKPLQDEICARRTAYLDLGHGRKKSVSSEGLMLWDDGPKHLREVRCVQITDPRWLGNCWVECIVIDASEESHEPE